MYTDIDLVIGINVCAGVQGDIFYFSPYRYFAFQNPLNVPMYLNICILEPVAHDLTRCCIVSLINISNFTLRN